MLIFLIADYTPLARASKALGWTLAFTAILIIPLSVSFVDLIKHDRLEASLKQALLNRTNTFERMELISTKANWLSDPPQVV
jgi:hypothetical protein